MREYMWFIVVWMLLLQFYHPCTAEGVFQLEIMEIFNYRGERLAGGCCGQRDLVTWSGVRSGRDPSGQCRWGQSEGARVRRSECRTSFGVCLKQFQRPVRYNGACEFGNATTGVLGGNSFQLEVPRSVVFPFSFSWLSFTLIISAFDNVGQHEEPLLIDRASFVGRLPPSDQWLSRTHHGHVARIVYRMRVQCDPGYYGSKCTRLCRSRDDLLGHYECDSNGDKLCLPGWTGSDCRQAICKSGCHPANGNCTQPGECKCSTGWQGELCDQCQTYPGCKHGYCHNQPHECICQPKWGGMLCDQDLDYCGTHHPCVNGGTCHPVNPGTYVCSCPPGFTGEHCQVMNNSCAVNQPCQHGGTCLERDGHLHCLCTRGWTGPHCEHRVEQCSDRPCVHALACRDLTGRFQCDCQPGWSGRRCDVREEVTDPVVATGCTSSVCDTLGGLCVVGSDGLPQCRCHPGFKGERCETADCKVNTCMNGGECRGVGEGGVHQCVCPPNFTGSLCQIKLDPCSSLPCYHGSTCQVVNSNNRNGSVGFGDSGTESFICHCPPGRYGRTCDLLREEETSPCPHGSCHKIGSCESNPCRNGGTCSHRQDTSFTCTCTSDWTGPRCEQQKRMTGPKRGLQDTCVLYDGARSGVQHYAVGASWRARCNTCRCLSAGRIQCTRLVCGLRQCQTTSECSKNEVCVHQPENQCLAKPCKRMGQCQKLTLEGATTDHTLCAPDPASTDATDGCALLQVTLRHHLMAGTSVSSLCADLRQMLSVSQADRLKSAKLTVQCRLSPENLHSLLVSMHTSEPDTSLPSDLAIWLAYHLNSSHTNRPESFTGARVMSADSENRNTTASADVSTVITLVTSLLVAMAAVVSCLLAALLQHRRRVRTLQRQVSDGKLSIVSAGISPSFAQCRVHNKLNNLSDGKSRDRNELAEKKGQMKSTGKMKEQLNGGFHCDSAASSQSVDDAWPSGGGGGNYCQSAYSITTDPVNINQSGEAPTKQINKTSLVFATMNIPLDETLRPDLVVHSGEVLV